MPQECTTLTKLLLEANDNPDFEYVSKYSHKDNFIYNNVFARCSNDDQLYLRFDINQEDIIVDEINKYDAENPTTLIDAVGTDKEFQLLFKAIEDTTILSKKEISKILRKDSKCYKVKNGSVSFGFEIPRIKIVSKDAYLGIE